MEVNKLQEGKWEIFVKAVVFWSTLWFCDDLIMWRRRISALVAAIFISSNAVASDLDLALYDLYCSYNWRNVFTNLKQGSIIPMRNRQTSLSTALKRPLLVFLDLRVAVFLETPNLFWFLLFMVSAFSLGASPSITKTNFTPISVRDDTRKNKFLQHTKESR